MKSFIMVLDIGTTNLKCHIYCDSLKSIYGTTIKIEILTTSKGYSEINPDVLWNSIIAIVNRSLKETHLKPSDISCLGLSCHRNSFITWDQSTSYPFHNLITWKDRRASDEVRKLNSSIFMKILKFICYGLYSITGSPQFLTAALLKFTNAQITGRLLWMLSNNDTLKEAVLRKQVMFGSLDTWLLYRLTRGRTYCTDVSCASATGMYDPFTSSWTSLIKFFGIPISILPPVCDSAGLHFGQVSSRIWGAKIPITCVVADQAAALYGSGCLKPGQMKITLGTGAFFDINVGSRPIANKSGFYPLITWKIEGKCTYALEAGCDDCGTIINWLMSLGFCENVKYLSSMAKSVSHTSGIYFISTFSDLHKTFEDVQQTSSHFIGITKHSKKEHFVRAVLESIVYRIYELYESYFSDPKLCSGNCIKLNGGVSNNNFICQTLANICDVVIQRSLDPEMSIRGVAILAGQTIGICNPDYIDDAPFETFLPNVSDGVTFRSKYTKWRMVRSNFVCWYHH